MRFYYLCVKSKYCIYTLLIVNILMNILFLSVFILICYNITIMNLLQIIYLISAIMSWSGLTFYYFYKVFLIIFGKYSEENYQKKIWKIIHLPPYIIIIIALFYDLIKVPSKSGSIGWLFYFLIVFILCFLFIMIGNFDYFAIRNQIEYSKSKSRQYPFKEEQDRKDINKSTTKINN